MAEVLDPDGVWDEDLIALMLPVAIELEADQAEATFGAVAAAASSLFGKEGAESFREGIKRVREEVRNAQGAARESAHVKLGRASPRQGSKDAQAMLDIFSRLGVKPRRRSQA